jgi:hypothetical protein
MDMQEERLGGGFLLPEKTVGEISFQKRLEGVVLIGTSSGPWPLSTVDSTVR